MTVPRTESITLLTVEGLPRDIAVDHIADRAANQAFAVIAESLADAGFPVTGDIDPAEAAALQRVFGMFVHAMAVNNPTLCDPIRWAYPISEARGLEMVSVEVEACEPDEIPRNQDVQVEIVATSALSSHCPIARLTGTRAAVARLLFDSWAGPAGDLDWFTETMDSAQRVSRCDDCGAILCAACGQPIND